MRNFSADWLRNIRVADEVAQRGRGPSRVVAVVGSDRESSYWNGRLAATCLDLYGKDTVSRTMAVSEPQPLGNFLGVLNGWKLSALGTPPSEARSGITLMSILLGKGSRLSPFTQALGNRKAAFPTLRRINDQIGRMCIAELGNWTLGSLIADLRAAGFQGVFVKWGDEASIPSLTKLPPHLAFDDVDAVRLATETAPTESLALQKDWLVTERASALLRHEIPRQTLSSLRSRIAENGDTEVAMGVNLGSFALTHPFLDALVEVFDDVLRSGSRGPDWDPYFWMALLSGTKEDWNKEVAREEIRSPDAIAALLKSIPDFFARVSKAKQVLQSVKGRPLRVITLDLGETLWIDFGGHESLVQHYHSLLREDELGTVCRALLQLPNDRDSRGNIIVDSSVPSGAGIRNSLIVGAAIEDSRSVADGAVIAGGRYGRVQMPHGGIAVDSIVGSLVCLGSHAMAFRSAARELVVENFGKHTTILIPDLCQDLLGVERYVGHDSLWYQEPILGNPFSFRDAGARLEQYQPDELERYWIAAAKPEDLMRRD